jgi:hypothetical protein
MRGKLTAQLLVPAPYQRLGAAVPVGATRPSSHHYAHLCQSRQSLKRQLATAGAILSRTASGGDRNIDRAHHFFESPYELPQEVGRSRQISVATRAHQRIRCLPSQLTRAVKVFLN